jgi:glycerophosphoryl diester phosphodiesterase
MKIKTLALLTATLFGLVACTQTAPPQEASGVTPPLMAAEADRLPPIRTYLNCLPPEAGLLAAHRGTGKNVGAPENSLSGLEALIEGGVMMAEIDIASIKDGTMISFHDGVWEEKASGRGPVVATMPEDFDRIRLRLTEGGTIGGERVPTLQQMLEAAKGRIYLELDFKSSANIGKAIEMIRAMEMEDEVVLIASRDEEGEELKSYGDEFVLSLPYRVRKQGPGAKQGVWVGSRWREDAQPDLAAKHYMIGSQWERPPSEDALAAANLDIIATDEPLRGAPIVGLSDPEAFAACLAEG